MAHYSDRAIPDQSIDRDIEVEIDVTLTIKRRVKVKVDDYTTFEETSDDEEYYQNEIDYSTCDWDDALERAQVIPEGWDILDQLVVYP